MDLYFAGAGGPEALPPPRRPHAAAVPQQAQQQQAAQQGTQQHQNQTENSSQPHAAPGHARMRWAAHAQHMAASALAQLMEVHGQMTAAHAHGATNAQRPQPTPDQRTALCTALLQLLASHQLSSGAGPLSAPGARTSLWGIAAGAARLLLPPQSQGAGTATAAASSSGVQALAAALLQRAPRLTAEELVGATMQVLLLGARQGADAPLVHLALLLARVQPAAQADDKQAQQQQQQHQQEGAEKPQTQQRPQGQLVVDAAELCALLQQVQAEPAAAAAAAAPGAAPEPSSSAAPPAAAASVAPPLGWSLHAFRQCLRLLAWQLARGALAAASRADSSSAEAEQQLVEYAREAAELMSGAEEEQADEAEEAQGAAEGQTAPETGTGGGAGASSLPDLVSLDAGIALAWSLLYGGEAGAAHEVACAVCERAATSGDPLSEQQAAWLGAYCMLITGGDRVVLDAGVRRAMACEQGPLKGMRLELPPPAAPPAQQPHQPQAQQQVLAAAGGHQQQAPGSGVRLDQVAAACAEGRAEVLDFMDMLRQSEERKGFRSQRVPAQPLFYSKKR